MAPRHRPLVSQYLEHAASSLLAEYGDAIRAQVGRSHGVYALYKRDSLYYVGLAIDLRRRLKQHLRDRHVGRWDNFSVYLTLDSAYMKELESLIIRIAMPGGNRNRGKFARSQDLLRALRGNIAKRQADELDGLFRGHIGTNRTRSGAVGPARSGRSQGTPMLARWIDGPMKLRRDYKGRRYSASVRRDGTIIVRGTAGRFNSPSLAARAVVGRRVNGWTFWKYKAGPGNWAPLTQLRVR